MWVVPDTTAMFADPFLNATPWIVVSRLADDGELRVAVPEVVVLEAIGHRRSKVTEALHSHSKASQRLRGLDIPFQALDVDPGVIVNDYERQLRERLCRIGQIEAIPALSHQALVHRAVARSKPFNEKGAGYRDALIFETLLTLAADDEVAFISNNHSDFCTGPNVRDDGTREIHPQLAELLMARNLDPTHIHIFPDVAAFTRNEVGDDLTAWLISDAGDMEGDLLEAVSERHVTTVTRLVDKYLYDTWPELGVEVMTPHNVDDMVVEEVADVGDFSIEEAQTDDGLVIRGKLTARATLTLDFSVEPYSDHDWLHYGRRTEEAGVEVRMTVEWERETDELRVTDLEGPFGGYIELYD